MLAVFGAGDGAGDGLLFAEAHVWWDGLRGVSCDGAERDGCQWDVHCGGWAAESVDVVTVSDIHCGDW